MNYIELQVKYTAKADFFADLITAELGEIGYDSFIQETDIIKAYIEESIFSEENISSLINTNNKEFGTVLFSWQKIETVNWNTKWEEQFQPVEIDSRCIIKAPFHKVEKKYEMEVIIEPKMSFGTGHHSTTSLVVESLLDIDCNNKSVVDCGSGTGILAIVAAMKGASSIKAFDIDDWCYENTLENIELNDVDKSKFEVFTGGFEVIKPNETFDIVIANINRNILINSMQQLADCMKDGSILLLSGFYEEDIPQIKDAALQKNLKFVSFKEKNRWVTCSFTK